MAAALPALVGPVIPDFAVLVIGATAGVILITQVEILSSPVSIDGLVRAKQNLPALSCGFFVFGMLATILYLRLLAGVTKPLQLVVSTVAFCVWAISIESPSTYLPGYDPIYGAAAMPIFTFPAGMIKP